MAASLVHQAASMPAAAAAAAGAVMACEDEFIPQSFGCFGRSLSRASSGRRLEYRALSEGEERSARAKLRWKVVAQEIMGRRRACGGGRRRKAPAPAFSYDSKSYALNFDQGRCEIEIAGDWRDAEPA